MSLFNPYVILSVIVALVFSFFAGRNQAYKDQMIAVQVQQMKEDKKEEGMKDAVADNRVKFVKGEANAQIENVRLKSALASSELRLSIASRQLQASTDSRAPTGAGDQARCDIDPEAAQRIVTITQDGDSAIRQLNALIDTYNQVKDKQK
jgi:hypothetical protein